MSHQGSPPLIFEAWQPLLGHLYYDDASPAAHKRQPASFTARPLTWHGSRRAKGPRFRLASFNRFNRSWSDSADAACRNPTESGLRPPCSPTTAPSSWHSHPLAPTHYPGVPGLDVPAQVGLWFEELFTQNVNCQVVEKEINWQVEFFFF